MHSSRVSRWAPLTGIVAAALMAAAVLLSGETPDTGDGGQRILDFYSSNESDQTASAILLGYGSLFLIFFASSLRSGLRRANPDAEGPATLAFGGGLLMATGLMLLAGITAAFVQNTDALDPIAAQAVNALNDGIWMPFIAGQSVFLLGSGVAILRGGSLPSWLGWVAIVLGVVSTTPVGFFAFFVTLVWIVVVAVLLTRRASQAKAAEASGE